MGKPINWDDIPLGDLPDAEISRYWGYRTEVIMKARRRKGIPEFSLCSKCSECGEPRADGEMLRRQWVCEECMLRDDNPLRVEDFVYGSHPLSRMGDMPSSMRYGEPRHILRALTKGMQRLGIAKTGNERMRDDLGTLRNMGPILPYPRGSE